MVSHVNNERMCLTGAAAPAGKLLRLYWQPVALAEELAGSRPVKAVRLMGEDLVLFRDEEGGLGLLNRACRIAAPILPLADVSTAGCAVPSMAGFSTSQAGAWRRQPSRKAVAFTSASARGAIPCARSTDWCSHTSAPTRCPRSPTSTASSRRTATPSRSRA